MIHIPNSIRTQCELVLGDWTSFHCRPETVWHERTIDFLTSLSTEIRRHPEAKSSPDLMALAFWLRKSHLLSMRRECHTAELSMGLGLTFHICPSNVPINFAYSLAFALLAGNSCVLRLSSKSNRATEIVLQTLTVLINKPENFSIAKRILLLSYQYNDDISAFWFSKAAGKVIWGGDSTINKMRQFPTPPRSREVAFADRYSFCVINAEYVLSIDNNQLQSECQNIFNDIYQLDQAGCSSPQLCIWVGSNNSILQAKGKIWQNVSIIAAKKRTDVNDIQVLNKFVNTCDAIIDHDQVTKVDIISPQLTLITVDKLNIAQHQFRGTSGQIYEASIQSLDELVPLINEKVQTLSYLGIDKYALQELIINNNLTGIDRIVPTGKALNMHNLWDGYDIIAGLSRTITIE